MGPSGCLSKSDVICDAHGRLEYHYEPGKEKLSSVVYRAILSIMVLILKLVCDWTKSAQVSLLGDKREMVPTRNEVASVLHNVCERSNTNFILQRTELNFRQISGWLHIQEYLDYVLRKCKATIHVEEVTSLIHLLNLPKMNFSAKLR